MGRKMIRMVKIPSRTGRNDDAAALYSTHILCLEFQTGTMKMKVFIFRTSDLHFLRSRCKRDSDERSEEESGKYRRGAEDRPSGRGAKEKETVTSTRRRRAL
jgi:hypothetical protein